MNNSKKMVFGFLLAALGLLFSTFSLAESKQAGTGPNPYVDCGIGAALFPETHWAAVSSNVIWDLGTTAAVSATASPETCAGKKVEAALFIGNTYEKLAEETAAGQGEHLTTALNLFECAPVQHSAAIQNVRAAMGHEVSNVNYMNQSKLEQASRYYMIMQKAVSSSCSV